MIALGIVNWRLMRDPTIASRTFWSSAAGHGKSDLKTGDGASSQACEGPAGHVRPEVTFYRKLMAPDERERTPETSEPSKETLPDSEQQKSRNSDSSQQSQKRNDADRKTAPAWQIKGQGSVQQGMIPPRPEVGAKAYTVQVGAFSHPGIAQQWAARWKARGYDVTLRPVARSDGIIYRLYLGKFSTESEADELVRRLKAKEGITAFRLAIRN
jgi:septal ring-binding cell division protein DamX